MNAEVQGKLQIIEAGSRRDVRGGAPSPRATKAEVEERVEFMAFLLARRLPHAALKRQFRKKYGAGLAARTVAAYASRAREAIIAETGKSRVQHALESLAFWESIVSGPDATLRERMDAQREIDSLLGLHAPVKIAPTMPDGEKPYASLSDEQLNQEILELQAELRAAGWPRVLQGDGVDEGGQVDAVH
jgi:hypothetical protein